MKKFIKVLEEANAKASVFWINPDDHIYVVTNHVDAVIDNPKVYGFSLDQLKDIYKKHNEPFGEYAGEANSEILEILLNQGWIRIRCKWNLDLCLITLGKHYIRDTNTLSSINAFANEYLNHQTEVTINVFGGNTPLRYTGKQVKSSKFLEEKFAVKLNSVVLKG